MYNMTYLILGTVLVLFSIFVVLVRMLKRRTNQMLVELYKQCDDIREHIHKATSKAEIAEIARDLEHVQDTFVHELPESVTQKELNLLYRLLEKKTKKLN